MTYTDRIDHTAVIFRKGSKIFIDDRLVAVASRYGGSQIIRDNGRRNTFKITHDVLASPYQAFLALRPYGFAVGIMTERKDGNEYFGFLRFARHFINNLKSVASKINIHLITCIVLDVTDDLIYFSRLKETDGHTCGPCYGKYKTGMPFP